MKLISQLKIKYIFVLLLTTFACSDDDGNGNKDDTHPAGESYIDYSVSGDAVNGNFSISSSQDSEQTNITITGGLYNEDTNEGAVKVANLVFSRSENFGENYRDVKMSLPSHTGSLALGEIETGPTGMITNEPTYNMKLSFDEEAFYDSDNDNDNDLITDLLSKSVSVTIEEFEETTNASGPLNFGIAHIKGSFEGEAYFKAFTGPTSDPQLILHTITGEFEYYIP